jgi:hypothetical protein
LPKTDDSEIRNTKRFGTARGTNDITRSVCRASGFVQVRFWEIERELPIHRLQD